MPTPTPTLFTVVGNWTNPDGTAAAGTVTFQAANRREENSDTIQVAIPKKVQLVNGAITVQLVVDTGGYNVIESITGSAVGDITYAIPGGPASTTVDLGVIDATVNQFNYGNIGSGTVPRGGTTGQVLTKLSGNDFDTGFATQIAASESFTGVADVNHTGTTTDRFIGFTSLSAARSTSLPKASTVHPGYELLVADASGSASLTVTISVTPFAGDHINGVVSAAVINAPFQILRFESDGVGNWYYSSGGENTAHKGVANGYASLDGSARVPLTQLVSNSGAADGAHFVRDDGTLAIPGGAAIVVTTQQVGTTYTLTLADQETCVEFTNVSPVTVTIPNNTSVAFPVGSIIELSQVNTGTVTIAGAAGVQVDAIGGVLSTAGQFSSAVIRKRATNEWIVESSGATGVVTSVAAGTGVTVGGTSSAPSVSVNYGTGAGTAAQGNDSRITGAEQISNRNTANGYAGLDAQGKIAATLVPTTLAVNTQTGASYTLVLSDAGCVVEGNNASATTFTIPPNSAVAFPVGTLLEVRQVNAGIVTIAAGAGVTLDVAAGVKATAGPYTTLLLHQRAANEWVVESGQDSGLIPQTSQSGTTYTLALADAQSVVEFTNAGTVAITVPTNAVTAFAIGTVIELFPVGAGQLVVSGSGITFQSAAGLKSRVQFSTVVLRKRGTDTWAVSGDTTT